LSLLALIISISNASAQETSALTPSFGNGVLSIAGAGFKPNEKVTITVKLNGTSQQVTATADAQGNFNINTGIRVQPGASLELNARGDQGTNVAAITAVPGTIPQTGAPAPSTLPLALTGLLMLLVGLAVLRQTPPHRN
jgi:hypothetical protein